MVALAQLSKANSLPSLTRMGLNVPKDRTGNEKKATLVYRSASRADLQTCPAVSKKAFDIANSLKTPGWRVSIPELRPQPEEQTVPANMRWPRLAPAWLKHEKQCLRFYGYFQEAVVERWDENCRYRNVVIIYGLEDGTVQISEPKVENSGITQGQFLRRHQVVKEDGTGFIGPGDLRCGREVLIYGRNYHITGCDRFTRWFYEENGIDVGEDEPLAKDQWQKSYTFSKIAEKGGLPMSRSVVDSKHLGMCQLGAPPANKKLIQFLLNDQKVLRFKAYWDDETAYGNRIYFTVHYYLSDNSVEINEAHPRNSGRDNYPVFYRRAPLLKQNRMNAYPGMLEPDPMAYEPKDLIVGDSINVWGRKVVLYDCDDFTQQFYKEYMEHDQKRGTINVSEIPKRHQKLHPPPHNGIGSQEDSMMNVLMVQPKPPEQDLQRLMALSGEILRFEATLVSGEAEDENRKFIVGWFPADYKLACWEISVRNSGHMAGKFAEKARRHNPETKEYFKLTDLFVGATVTINSHPFYLKRADEHTLKFLESCSDEYPMADPIHCATKLSPLSGSEEIQNKAVDPDVLKDLASSRGVSLLDHEVITLIRNFGGLTETGEPAIDGHAILEAISRSRQ